MRSLEAHVLPFALASHPAVQNLQVAQGKSAEFRQHIEGSQKGAASRPGT